MPRTRNPYPTEFREQMVGLVRTGRSVESLAREYEPRAATIHEWVRQAAADDGDEAKMRCLKAFGERIASRDPDRQTAEIHIRILRRLSRTGGVHLLSHEPLRRPRLR